MSFGFTMNSVDTNGPVKRTAARPLRSFPWADIKEGLRVQSMLNDAYGLVIKAKEPYLTIAWDNGNVSKDVKKAYLGSVDVIDEQDEIGFTQRVSREETVRINREMRELERLITLYPAFAYEKVKIALGETK